MKTKLYILSLLLLSLAACTDDELCLSGNTPSQTLPEGYYFILSTSDGPTTRVVYADQNTSRFEEGDQVGIFAINNDNATLVTGTEGNARYQVQEVTNTNGSTSQVLVPAEGTTQVPEGCRYIFYYPYRGDMTLEEITALTHTVESNQNEWTDGETHSVTPYEYSDLLWDVESEQTTSTGQAYVEVAMDHAMANIILEIDESYLKEGSTVALLNVLTTAEGINLSTTSLEALNYSAIGDKSNITMWSFGYATSGNQAFRAAIPAQSLTEGTKLFRIINAEGQKRVYSLSESIEMKPGKNYIFRVIKGSLQPELNDDDSWVLDVLDPETGEPVGLLCREYLRYQPGHTGDKNFEKDEITGTPTSNDSYNISSQAWVFYRLLQNSQIPDLNTGYVLCFIYDILTTDDSNYCTSQWPYPYYRKYMTPSMFTPEHGHKWVEDYDGGYGKSSEDLRPDFKPMHNGIITWDGINNEINSFIMPKEIIDNSTAYTTGHIAIPNNGEAPFTSYSSINSSNNNYDADGNKVGILMHHYLIDKRRNRQGEVEINRYPLVKIGYNQFWISKPMNGHTFVDGTPLICYNTKETPGVTFADEQTLTEPGYMYPYAIINDGDEKGVQTYDPYNIIEQRTPEGTTFRPTPVYNKLAITNENFTPRSEEGINEYKMPTMVDIETMSKYFGWCFAAKMCTRAITEFDHTNISQSRYGRFTAVLKGESFGFDNGYQPQANAYTANISGLNLRSIGYYTKATGFTANSGSAALILNTKNEGIDAFIFNTWEAFRTKLGEETSFWNNTYYNQSVDASQFFAQVRFFMKYRNQADTGGSSLSVTTTNTRSVSGSGESESCNIYVPIQPAD